MTQILKHNGSPAAEVIRAVVALEQGWPDEWVMHPLVVKELQHLNLLDSVPITQYQQCSAADTYQEKLEFMGIRVRLDDKEPYSTTMQEVVERSLKHKPRVTRSEPGGYAEPDGKPFNRK